MRRYVAPPSPVPLVQGPYRGMRDSHDPTAARPDLAFRLSNAYPGSAAGIEGVWGRPGFTVGGSTLAGAGQRSYQFTQESTGDEFTIDFAGGQMYVYDHSAGTHTALDLAGAGISLDPDSFIYCITFVDTLIFHDGVSKPVQASVAGGVWTFAVLTNAPVFFGPLVVHSGKIVGILADEPNAIAWSEENQPNVGYEATIGPATYTNAWRVTQTEQERFYGIGADENLLILWRERSTTAISGRIDEEFQTTATREAVEAPIGTKSPSSIVRTPGGWFILDADGHPQLLRGRQYVGTGGDTDPIWYDCRETTRHLPRADLPTAVSCYYTPADLVLMGVTDYGGVPLILVLNAHTGQFCGRWEGIPFRTLDLVKDADGVPTLRHIDGDGNAHSWGHPQGEVWSDTLSIGERAIRHEVLGAHTAYDGLLEKEFVQIDLSLRLTSDLSGVKVSYVVPGRSGPTLTPPALSGGFMAWGDEWGGRWSRETVEGHTSIGIAGCGRWLQPLVHHATLGEQFGLLSITVLAQPIGVNPLAG